MTDHSCCPYQTVTCASPHCRPAESCPVGHVIVYRNRWTNAGHHHDDNPLGVSTTEISRS